MALGLGALEARVLPAPLPDDLRGEAALGARFAVVADDVVVFFDAAFGVTGFLAVPGLVAVARFRDGVAFGLPAAAARFAVACVFLGAALAAVRVAMFPPALKHAQTIEEGGIGECWTLPADPTKRP